MRRSKNCQTDGGRKFCTSAACAGRLGCVRKVAISRLIDIPTITGPTWSTSSVPSAICFAASAALLASAAQAAPVNIDGVGFQISYDNAALGVLGAGPTSLVGNVLTLTPAGSPGLSANSTGPSSTAAAASFSFTADPGYAIAGFSLAAGGSYYYFGSASVAASGALDVDLGGSTESAVLTPTGGVHRQRTFQFHDQRVVLAGRARLHPGNGGRRRSLAADAGAGGQRTQFLIHQHDKCRSRRHAGAGTLPNNSVPEPSTALLALAALGVLKLRRRASA